MRYKGFIIIYVHLKQATHHDAIANFIQSHNKDYSDYLEQCYYKSQSEFTLPHFNHAPENLLALIECLEAYCRDSQALLAQAGTSNTPLTPAYLQYQQEVTPWPMEVQAQQDPLSLYSN